MNSRERVIVKTFGWGNLVLETEDSSRNVFMFSARWNLHCRLDAPKITGDFGILNLLLLFQCVACATNRATMQTFPCAHQAVCRTCFVRMIQAAVAAKKLPLR